MKIRSLIYLLVILFLFIGSTCDKNTPVTEITEVLHALENLGLSEDTIVVFSSDHGETLTIY